jgi:hypothetical protein
MRGPGGSAKEQQGHVHGNGPCLLLPRLLTTAPPPSPQCLSSHISRAPAPGAHQWTITLSNCVTWWGLLHISPLVRPPAPFPGLAQLCWPSQVPCHRGPCEQLSSHGQLERFRAPDGELEHLSNTGQPNEPQPRPAGIAAGGGGLGRAVLRGARGAGGGRCGRGPHQSSGRRPALARHPAGRAPAHPCPLAGCRRRRRRPAPSRPLKPCAALTVPSWTSTTRRVPSACKTPPPQTLQSSRDASTSTVSAQGAQGAGARSTAAAQPGINNQRARIPASLPASSAPPAPQHRRSTGQPSSPPCAPLGLAQPGAP